MSEKTDEGYLTGLFAKTGCRTRVQLTTARLGGRSLGHPDIHSSWKASMNIEPEQRGRRRPARRGAR